MSVQGEGSLLTFLPLSRHIAFIWGVVPCPKPWSDDRGCGVLYILKPIEANWRLNGQFTLVWGDIGLRDF